MCKQFKLPTTTYILNYTYIKLHYTYVKLHIYQIVGCFEGPAFGVNRVLGGREGAAAGATVVYLVCAGGKVRGRNHV